MLQLVITHLRKSHVLADPSVTLNDVVEYLNSVGIGSESLYFTHNGKLLYESDYVTDGTIYAVPRLVGGKGGFGSMLRAIGAQIEKTTNREACRDLSGRRLRDINEEKRLKNWIAQQADREREAAEKRKKKLERLCAEPKHEFDDKEYDKARSELLEKVWDAVDQGMKASTSGCSSSSGSNKRKLAEQDIKSKKARLWVDEIEDLSSSADSEDSEDEEYKRSGKEETEKKSDEITNGISTDSSERESIKDGGVGNPVNEISKEEEKSKNLSLQHVEGTATADTRVHDTPTVLFEEEKPKDSIPKREEQTAAG